MGANHFSQSVFGADPVEVRALLVRWMEAKGFDLQSGPPLTALDPKHERGLLLAWREDRTVAMFSDLTEQARMLFELKKLGVPVLDYWMHDSDIWGYQLWHEGAVVDAFHSNPAYFGGFEDIEGPRDIPALCRTLGLSGAEEEIAALQKGKAVFVEGISAKFVEKLGVAAAASQYGYSADAGWPPEGFESASLAFRRAGWDPMAGWDVDRLRFEVMRPESWAEDLSDEDRAAFEDQMRWAKWTGWVFQVLFWPVSLVFRAWMWWRMRGMQAQLEGMAQDIGDLPQFDGSSYPKAFDVVDDRLVSVDHGCSIRLPAGAEVTEHHSWRLGPGQVFRFQVGDSHVAVQALMPSQAEQMTRFGPQDSAISEDRFETGGRRVRWVEHTWNHPHGSPSRPEGVPERMWRVMAFVAGPRAVYQFSASDADPPRPELVVAVRQAVESLRFDTPE